MRSAVVGYGVIGRHHAKLLSKMGYLSAVCDINSEVLAGLDGVALYSDYTEMLEREKLDAVHICTPHYLHADMIIAALDRGIHVLCEKPMCIREEDICRILEAEKRSGAMLGVCHQNRYNAANLYVKDYIRDKELQGGVGQVSWLRDANYYRSGTWRGKWDSEGGGVLINQALHTLDLMIWFCGMPDNLSASISNLTLDGVIEVEDTAAICAKGEHGFNFYASNGSAVDLPVEITLKVSGDAIKIMPKYAVVGGEILKFDNTAPTGIKLCYGSGHAALLADFYDCIMTGRKFEIDGAEASKVIKVILAAYRSNGKSLKIK